MSRAEYFSWLLLQASGALAVYWPVTATLLGLVLVATIVTFRRRQISKASHVLWTLSPLCLATAILILGTVFENPDPSHGVGVTWPVYVVYALLLAHLPATVIIALVLKRLKWLATAIASLSAWASWWAAFVSIMSITGDWI